MASVAKVGPSMSRDKHAHQLLDLPYLDVGFDGLLEKRADRVEIDERLVPLLQLLWSRGIETNCSCQGGPDKKVTKGKLAGTTARQGGYLGFPTRASFARFLALISHDMIGLANSGVFEVYFFDERCHKHDGVTLRFDHPRLDDFVAFVRDRAERT